MHPVLRRRGLIASIVTAVAFTTGRAVEHDAQDPQDPAPIDYTKQIEPLFAKYCFRCHGDKKQKGDVQLNILDPKMTARADAEGWHSALDMINGAEMPPDDEDQMSDQERRLMVRWMQESLKIAAERQKGERRVVMRRLTRDQYTHSLQDLLGVKINFAQTLPDDGKSKNGFSNNGEVLQASSLHLDNYQIIARHGLSQAIARAKPKVTHYRVTFGKDLGAGKVAGKTGGYQSVALNPNDFTVEILENGRVITGGTDEQIKERNRIQRKISVGLRGSGQDRFRSVDEGIMLLSALPRKEVVPASWQGPSPNLKLEMQRVWPEQGDFVMRVKASRGYVPPLRKQILVRLDEPIAMATLSDDDQLTATPSTSGESIFIPSKQSDQHKNLRKDGNSLVPVDVPKDSKVRVRFKLPHDGFYQIDLVHRPVKKEAMPSVRLKCAGHKIDERPEMSAAQMKRARVVTPLGVVGMRKGNQSLELGGPFFMGFTDVVITPLPDDHPMVHRLSSRDEKQNQAVKQLNPSIRALIGTRTDDGMDYTTFGDSQEVHAELGKAQTYDFFGRLENLPIPAPESGDNEILSGFLLLGVWNDHLVKSAKETGPPLLVESIEFEAPYLPQWPPQSHTNIFIDADTRSDDTAYTRTVLDRFVSRAFRRPAQADEVDRYLKFWQSIQNDYETYEDSIKEVLVAILCSPEFLFLCEPVSEIGDDHALPAWMLANRLSYFLWNSPPDAQLRELADGGNLRQELLTQVDRMLDDKRSSRFLRRFSYEWLRMDRHDSMTINVNKHPDYTRYVKRDMAEETYTFVEHVFNEDMPLSTLLQADFAMLNQNLAEFYGVEGVEGQAFRPVPIPTDKPERRGGLLSHGAFHVGHSDGTEPHPIKRAVWLKARLLGDEPPPPPPNVPDLDPETPGFDKMTLKQQIESHRDKASCRDCHAGIDPYGFVFERMNAVGRFQTKRKGMIIDATSTLPDGTDVDGLPGIQKWLVDEQQSTFARSVIEHLFAYALGRETYFADEEEIDQILAKVEADGFGARSVLRSIVTSPSFLSK